MPTRYYTRPVSRGAGFLLSALGDGLERGIANFESRHRQNVNDIRRRRLEDEAAARLNIEDERRHGFEDAAEGRQEYAFAQKWGGIPAAALNGGPPDGYQQVAGSYLPTMETRRQQNEPLVTGLMESLGLDQALGPAVQLGMEQGINPQAFMPWDRELNRRDATARATAEAARGRQVAGFAHDREMLGRRQTHAERLDSVDRMLDDTYGAIVPGPDGSPTVQFQYPQGHTRQSLYETYMGGGRLPPRPEAAAPPDPTSEPAVAQEITQPRTPYRWPFPPRSGASTQVSGTGTTVRQHMSALGTDDRDEVASQMYWQLQEHGIPPDQWQDLMNQMDVPLAIQRRVMTTASRERDEARKTVAEEQKEDTEPKSIFNPFRDFLDVEPPRWWRMNQLVRERGRS